jgi:hypothetical protein
MHCGLPPKKINALISGVCPKNMSHVLGHHFCHLYAFKMNLDTPTMLNHVECLLILITKD